MVGFVSQLGVLLNESQQLMLVIGLLWEQLSRITAQNLPIIFRQIKIYVAVLMDDFVRKQFSSYPSPPPAPHLHLKKYEWTCASGENFRVFVPCDFSEAEI